MNAHPILFQAAMVRALLNGSKTQTRRIVKPEGAVNVFQFRGTTANAGSDEPTGEWGWCGSERVVHKHIHCPYGKPGDQLWVRESWSDNSATHVAGVNQRVYYRADYPEGSYKTVLRWRPSIHMSRWASRITLEITSVHVERLNSITEVDAIAEGIQRGRDGMWNGAAHAVKGTPRAFHTAIGAYDDLWTHINGPESWAQNPWVWVVKFKVVKP